MSRCVIVLCFGECRMETFLITTAGSAVVDGLSSCWTIPMVLCQMVWLSLWWHWIWAQSINQMVYFIRQKRHSFTFSVSLMQWCVTVGQWRRWALYNDFNISTNYPLRWILPSFVCLSRGELENVWFQVVARLLLLSCCTAPRDYKP